MRTVAEHEHSFTLLDFYRIRERAADYCLSPEGRTLFLKALPLNDRELIHNLQEDCRAIQKRMEESEFPLLSFPDIDEAARKLSVEGSTLEIGEFYALSVWSKAHIDMVRYLAQAFPGSRNIAADEEGQEGPLNPEVDSGGIGKGTLDYFSLVEIWALWGMNRLVALCPDLKDVCKIISRVISPEGEMRDLPELRRIRESIARANKDLFAIADSFTNDPDLKSALQSGEATQRDGRTVLAVRANFRGRVKGIVHEVSSTGQTVFIEPAAIVEKNNELVRLKANLAMEEIRILRELTREVRAQYQNIRRARVCTALIDQRLGRALQCRREDLVLAETCDAGITLWRARHPLLEASKGNSSALHKSRAVVPIDVALPDTTRTLIITGPNTGGKTVTLKTLGLFALMHQFGLGLPAALGTKFQLFDGVFADIGDEQSIDQSLSTFSGHMNVVSDIVSRASGKSLVLLDELGAGTDPEEGCAIAMGLLDHFIDIDSLTITTTHHGILKNYGYTREKCLNASMEFDSTKLAPTYRIVMGVPGESRALEIASNIGLDKKIVNKARQYLDEERTDVGVLIRSLSEKHRELERLERDRRSRLKEAAEDQRKADLAILRVRRKEAELKKHGVSELNQLLAESRKTLENLVRELRESGVETSLTKEVKSFIGRLSDSVSAQEKILEEEEIRLLDDSRFFEEAATSKGASPRASSDHMFIEGGEVIIKSSGKSARLLRKAGGNIWIVEVGSIRMSIAQDALKPVARIPTQSLSYDVELRAVDGASAPKASFELDLRGFRLAEAISAVEKQIDAASLQGLNLFSIIHGTGEGVLGAGIHGYLQNSPVVEDYHFARPEEGGYGKTIVRLKV